MKKALLGNFRRFFPYPNITAPPNLSLPKDLLLALKQGFRQLINLSIISGIETLHATSLRVYSSQNWLPSINLMCPPFLLPGQGLIPFSFIGGYKDKQSCISIQSKTLPYY